jgi:hypothetical protein
VIKYNIYSKIIINISDIQHYYFLLCYQVAIKINQIITNELHYFARRRSHVVQVTVVGGKNEMVNIVVRLLVTLQPPLPKDHVIKVSAIDPKVSG